MSHGSDFMRAARFSLERPALSSALASIRNNEDAFQEAVGILQTIENRLQERPRADMPGFVPSPACGAREERHQERARIENLNRQAIREGRRQYDKGAPVPETSKPPVVTGY